MYKMNFTMWFFIVSMVLIMSPSSIISAKKLNVVRKGSSFGAVNFDRVAGYALVNATFSTIENIKVIECISKCKGNKGCHSLNFRKKASGGTTCELNEHDRYSIDSELSFQKKADSDYFEVQTPCKKVVCYNGGVCHANQIEGTHQCRCPLEFSGDFCQRKNIYVEKFKKNIGVVNGELFAVGNDLNYTMAETVCQAFGSQIASYNDINRIANESASKHCKPAWLKGGRTGYPEYQGNCHTGSTHTGYFQQNCCLDRSTLQSAWCLKKNFDFCQPDWYALGSQCFVIRDDDSVTKTEAEEICAKKGGFLAKKTDDAFGAFLNRVCPSCRGVFVGVFKANSGWKTDNGQDVPSSSWVDGQPSGEHACAEMNIKENGLKAVPCNNAQGYVCGKSAFH